MPVWTAGFPEVRRTPYFVGLRAVRAGSAGVRDAALGSSVARLERIRRAYDPHGLFAEAARRP